MQCTSAVHAQNKVLQQHKAEQSLSHHKLVRNSHYNSVHRLSIFKLQDAYLSVCQEVIHSASLGSHPVAICTSKQQTVRMQPQAQQQT
jgi:hypothetical protein